MSKKALISSIFVLIIVAALSSIYFIFKNKEDGIPSVPTDSTSGASVDVGAVKIDATSAAGSVEPVDIKDLPQAPSLNHAIAYSSSIGAQMRTQIERNVKDVVAVLKDSPYSLEAWLGLGVLYKQAGDYRAAEEAWKYANALSPGNIVSFNNLGDLYHYYLKEYPKAEDMFLKAIKNDKKYTLSYMNLFDLYRYSYKTDTTRAADALKQGIAANPENIDLVIALAAYYKEKGDKTNARTYYTQALAKAKTAGNTALATSLQAELDALK